MLVLLAVLLLATHSTSHGATPDVTTSTPQGWTLTLAGSVAPADAIDAIPYPGMGQAIRHVNETSGSRSWFSFALGNPDSLFWWPAGQTIELVLRDSSRVRPMEQMAVTELPAMTPIPLGEHTVRDASGRLLRKRFRNHGTATLVFAAFRPGLAMRDIAGMRVATPHADSVRSHP